MQRVVVKFYANIRQKAGVGEFACQAATVRDAIESLRQEYGEDFIRHVKSCNVFLNSDNVTMMQGPLTRLKEGDVLHIFPPMGGG